MNLMNKSLINNFKIENFSNCILNNTLINIYN